MTILNLKNISKNFGAIVALDGVSLDLKEGEVLGLMGDNGAGKSTLIKIIAGNFKQSDGEMLFEDQNVEFNKPMDARNKGIEVVYQDLALCDNLTAASNIFLTREPKKKIGPFGLIDFTKMFEKAKQLFAELKSETLPNETVRMMSGGQRQAVALARTKLSKAKVVLLDEPTAAISVRQVAEVLELIRQLKKQGISVVIISHRMPDVFAVSDRIAVLRRGKLVANKLAKNSSPEEVTALTLEEIFALGAAIGNLSSFNKFLVMGCFGNLTARVFFLFVAIFEIFEFFFRFRTNVIGPGQNFLYNLKKLLLR